MAIKEIEKVKIGPFRSLRFDGGYSNCKFSTLDGIQSSLSCNEKKTIKAIKAFVEKEVTWFVTLNDISYVNILKKEFTPIYVQKVPIGYYGGYQYHCLFRGGKTNYKYRLDKKPDKSQLISDKNLNKILNYKSKAWLKKFLTKFI